jgi:thiol-disulfide isomerase/thioredoxin
LVGLTPTALSKDGSYGVSVFASGLIETFAGDNRVLDDGTLLVAQRSSEAEVVANLAIDAKAPPLAAKTLEGKPLSLEDYRGKYVLLDFWATWCGPCVAEMPKMQDVQAAFGSDDRFVIIGLSLDREIEAAQSFVKDRGLAWVQAFCWGRGGRKSARRLWCLVDPSDLSDRPRRPADRPRNARGRDQGRRAEGPRNSMSRRERARFQHRAGSLTQRR